MLISYCVAAFRLYAQLALPPGLAFAPLLQRCARRYAESPRPPPYCYAESFSRAGFVIAAAAAASRSAVSAPLLTRARYSQRLSCLVVLLLRR